MVGVVEMTVEEERTQEAKLSAIRPNQPQQVLMTFLPAHKALPLLLLNTKIHLSAVPSDAVSGAKPASHPTAGEKKNPTKNKKNKTKQLI